MAAYEVALFIIVVFVLFLGFGIDYVLACRRFSKKGRKNDD
jgi:predicted exporter